MRLLQIGGVFLALLGLLASLTHQTAFFKLAVVLVFLMIGLLAYAWFRENFRNDKSL